MGQARQCQKWSHCSVRVEARATFRHSPALEGERAVLSLVVAVLGRLLDHIVAALGRFAGTVPSLIIGTPARIAGGRASRSASVPSVSSFLQYLCGFFETLRWEKVCRTLGSWAIRQLTRVADKRCLLDPRCRGRVAGGGCILEATLPYHEAHQSQSLELFPLYRHPSSSSHVVGALVGVAVGAALDVRYSQVKEAMLGCITCVSSW